GNFNEKTARVYADYGYFTADTRITSELEKAFSGTETGLIQDNYRYLWAAPGGMRKKITRLINREIKNARNGKPAYIIIKVNSLSDEALIAKLYEASDAGVKIRLIVRGICCLVPSAKGFSENIEAISIIDRYLEHARVYIFGNRGKELIYLSSADLMPRNLDHRFEIGFPVLGAESRRQIRDMIEIQWKDNTKSRIIDKAQQNRYRKSREKELTAPRGIFITI
ncbi:MAG TPA: phospholipase D-like domain-containing protein, partial [Anseongella sp.]|nr:phospholipase D-like domain-containing protein [Anseongella sp.]